MMNIHRAWDWTKERSERWMNPSEDSYYLLHRWSRLGCHRFLDLGSGRGRHAILFANHGFDVSAMDLSQDGIQELQTYAQEHELSIQCDVADMIHLPYPNESFDCLLAYHVISHTNRAGVTKVLDEVFRVLKVGGEAFVTFGSSTTLENRRDPLTFLEKNVIVKHEDGPEDGIPHFYPDAVELKEFLHRFEIIEASHRQNVDLNKNEWRGFHFFVLLKKPA